MLEAGIVGLPGSGKTTLFAALTGGQGAVGTVPIPDERLEPVARTVGAAKMTLATLQLVEVAGTGPAMLGNLRKMDALLGVVDGFSGTGDPEADRESLELELLIADRDHVERRLERVRSQAKSGDPRLREEVAEPLPPELEPLTTKPLVVVVNGPGQRSQARGRAARPRRGGGCRAEGRA